MRKISVPIIFNRGVDMEKNGYAEFVNGEWIFNLHEYETEYVQFFEGEGIKSVESLVERVLEEAEEMGWYEVQYEENEDGVMEFTVFYDTADLE